MWTFFVHSVGLFHTLKCLSSSCLLLAPSTRSCKSHVCQTFLLQLCQKIIVIKWNKCQKDHNQWFFFTFACAANGQQTDTHKGHQSITNTSQTLMHGISILALVIEKNHKSLLTLFSIFRCFVIHQTTMYTCFIHSFVPWIADVCKRARFTVLYSDQLIILMRRPIKQQ